MNDTQSDPDEQQAESIERLPWRWQRVKFASGSDDLADAARRDLAAEAEHSHRRRIKGA